MMVNRAKSSRKYSSGGGNGEKEEKKEKKKKNTTVMGGVRRALFTAELIRRNGATRSISRYLELLPDRGPTSVPPDS